MNIKSIVILLTYLLLLSSLTVPGIACPPPYCPGCCYWNGSTCWPDDSACASCYSCLSCECEDDCFSGDCCYFGTCVDPCPYGGCCNVRTCVITCPGCKSCLDGWCVDDDENCTGCESCVNGQCVDDSNNCDDCEECVDADCVDIGCDCTIPGPWRDMPVGTLDDECGNTLTLPLEYLFCYYYNGIKVGDCPYEHGANTILYWKTINNKRFYATYHESRDNTNDGSDDDEGTKYKYDSVIWWYDCISDSGTPTKIGIEHPTVKGGDDGTGSAFEESEGCPPL